MSYCFPPPKPNFCPHCGLPLEERYIPEEGRERLVCAQGHIFYLNPKVVVSVVAVREGRVLLLRRAIEPRRGYWTLPGGYMEIDESVEGCALRETHEETGLNVRLAGLLTILSRPAPTGPGIVSIVFWGETQDGELHIGPEVLEARFFSPQEIPWDALAYDTVREALRTYLAKQKELGAHPPTST